MSLALPAALSRRPSRRAIGPGLVQVLVVFAIALVTGLGTTWLCVVNNVAFGDVRAGPWLSRPRLGALDADPYSRALVARSGDIPLGLGEGVTFLARRDSGNVPLVGSCTYRIVGRVPSARYWTLTAHALDGSLLPNPAGRYGFTSAELVRDEKGLFQITASALVQPGNWLPIGPSRFELALRLYDTPVSGTVSVVEPSQVPRIERESCR